MRPLNADGTAHHEQRSRTVKIKGLKAVSFERGTMLWLEEISVRCPLVNEQREKHRADALFPTVGLTAARDAVYLQISTMNLSYSAILIIDATPRIS